MKAESVQVTVEGVPPDTYLERFAWNEAKYPPRRPLKETVAAVTETAQKLEDELKACPAFLQVLGGKVLVLCSLLSACLVARHNAHCGGKLCGVLMWKAVQRIYKSWQAIMRNVEASRSSAPVYMCVFWRTGLACGLN